MKNYTTTISFIAIIFISKHTCFSQDKYFHYYDLINRAEEEFVIQNNAGHSFILYDSAFANYNKPFVSDMFTASQMAYYAGDTTRFIKYISLCFNRGMNFDCLHSPSIFASLFSNQKLLNDLQHLYSTRKEEPVDAALRDSIYMHFHREELVKKSLGPNREHFAEMHREEKINVAYYAAFLDNGQFPSEQMIGLYTEASLDTFETKYKLATIRQPLPGFLTSGNKSMSVSGVIPDDYELCNKAALISYLHYPCEFYRNKDRFWKAVENGYLHPKDYCILEEWFANSIGTANYNHDCDEVKDPSYYNIYYSLRVTTPELLERVELNRKAHHVQKYSVDVVKRTMQDEKGFQLFYGFLSLR